MLLSISLSSHLFDGCVCLGTFKNTTQALPPTVRGERPKLKKSLRWESQTLRTDKTSSARRSSAYKRPPKRSAGSLQVTLLSNSLK